MFTDNEIETLATEYAEQENSCYTNDFFGFVSGFEKAIELLGKLNEAGAKGSEAGVKSARAASEANAMLQAKDSEK